MVLVQAHGTAIKSELEETAQDRRPKKPRTAHGSLSPLQGCKHPLPGAPAHMEAAESVTASLTSGAWEAPHARKQCSPGPKASAPGVSKLLGAADGNAGGTSQERKFLKQEPEARESALPKGSCKAGEQRGGGASSGLSSLPSIANLPRISSPYPELQVGDLTLCALQARSQLHYWTLRIMMPLRYINGS